MRRMYDDFSFFCGLGIGMVAALVLFFVLFGASANVPIELCSSIGEDFVKTISSNGVQCENTLIRIVPKEGANKEIKIISSDSIIGGE